MAAGEPRKLLGMYDYALAVLHPLRAPSPTFIFGWGGGHFENSTLPIVDHFENILNIR